MKTFPFIFGLVLAITSCNNIDYRDIAIDSSDIGYIMDISEKLSDLSPRAAGSEGEKLAGDLIETELKRMRITPVSEEFIFRTYNIDTVKAEINGYTVFPLFAGINPFEGPLTMKESAIFVASGESPSSSPVSKIMISDERDMFFMALQAGSKAFFCLDNDDFERLRDTPDPEVKVKVTGKNAGLSSRNIIVNIGNKNPSAGCISLTAHYDAYLDSPGANDNGTGVGALLMMARILKSCEASLPVNVRIIFLGAEEVGLAGSRQYLSDHANEFENCRLLVNFDTFGGNQAPYIATAKGLQGVPETGIVNQLDPGIFKNALEGSSGGWRLFDPAILSLVMATNYPGWLQAIVDSAAINLNMDVYNQHLMSDHLVFAGAGVPSISIQSREHKIHSSEDIPEHINYGSVASCFRLSWEILRLMIGEEG